MADPRVVLLLTVLGVYLIPIVFGPNCLKMETARCWGWITSVPLAFAANTLLQRPQARICALGAFGVALFTSCVMRLWMDFGV